MAYIWTAYDAFCTEVLSKVDASRAADDVERDITQLLYPHIQEAIDSFAPVYVTHGAFERASRSPAPAQPPACDLAFVLRLNPRVMWPLEAKVLRTPRQVADYVRTFHERFMTCVYAPFSSQGAMLAYLFSGDEDAAFAAIAASIPCTLNDASRLTRHPRPHRTSTHTRGAPGDKRCHRQFTCHHLILHMTPAARGAAATRHKEPHAGRRASESKRAKR